jgi:G8 domain
MPLPTCRCLAFIASTRTRCPYVWVARLTALVLFCLSTTALRAQIAALAGSETPIEYCNNTAKTSPRPLEAEVVTKLREVQHTLPAGDHRDTDLRIDGVACVVPKGTYVYRNVNIWGGGSLTFEDAEINFHAHSILVESGGTLEAGAGASGPVNGPISIWLYGAASDGIESITCKSGPTCGVPQTIWDSNPNVPMGTMPMGPCTPAAPNADCFYQYEKFDSTDIDGSFFGKKVLALSYGGTIILRGVKGVRSGPVDATPSDSGTSWVRLTDDLPAGKMSFHVDRPVPTWGNNDHIVLTTTDYLPGHSEELMIESVGSDSKGTVINLQKATQFPHYGTAYNFSGIAADKGPADDPNRQPGAMAGQYSLPSRHLETRAAVALLTRSIMIASEDQYPVLADRNTAHFTTGFYGGHTLVRDGFTQYQIDGVEFYQLGQGGVIGRYPVHFHMARKVPQPTTTPVFNEGTYVVDSSIHDSNTRFITVHATQGVLLARNVGYRSIGHGFYLEDATEINNRLYSNIGITSRAAVYDDLNDRSVPGIIARAGDTGQEVFPYHSDWDHPSVFWIMNTWNDFRYNVAVGAGTCGACYWMPPSEISGLSVYETWDSYAGMQTSGRGGVVPMMNFVGNSCSTAMNSLETVGNTAVCNGVSNDPLDAGNSNWLYAVPNAAQLYPTVDAGLRQHATLCNGGDCSQVKICTGDGTTEAGCAATVIDHYTTSFNWASTNFAAVWLRGWWFLMQNSAITDTQSAGFTAITGGGYTRSDVAQGFWNLSLRNLFVGNTQPNTAPCMLSGSGYTIKLPANAAASNAGPFNPCAIATCPYVGAGNGDHCVSKADGISMPIGPFANAQRLFSIYDGPVFEDSDAFADITTTDVGTLGECKKPVGGPTNQGSCQGLGFMNAFQAGVLQYPSPPSDPTMLPKSPDPTNHCILPNAAIAWKQPNGFYYPPSFHSKNLAFSNVQIRHYVIDPPWYTNTFNTNLPVLMNTYCSWQNDTFGTNFTDIDRQTELSDDDGALTGLVSQTVNQTSQDPSISVNKDPFFNAPLSTAECSSSYPGGTYQSNATADTSGYQYVSTVIYPDCTTGGGCSNWGDTCTNQTCAGVPLYRYYVTNNEFTNYQKDPTTRPEIRLMGQVSVQRSNLTMNHGWYYIDTTLGPQQQGAFGNPNIFKANQTYYMFFPYAVASATEKAKTFHQTYEMYIGKVSLTDGLAAVVPALVGIHDKNYTLSMVTSGNWITKNYDMDSGLLTVTIDLSGQTDVFDTDRKNFCQPASYCTYDSSAGTCGCAAGNTACKAADNVCSWGIKDIDCPTAGCFGFAVTMPGAFTATGPIKGLPPPPIHFIGDPTSDPYFDKKVAFVNVDSSVSGSECHYETPPAQQP